MVGQRIAFGPEGDDIFLQARIAGIQVSSVLRKYML